MAATAETSLATAALALDEWRNAGPPRHPEHYEALARFEGALQAVRAERTEEGKA